MPEERLVAPDVIAQDVEIENILRPRVMSEYVGQNKVKENLTVFMQAAKSRGEALDHVLLYGPPGLGKTTLANIIANEMGSHLKTTSGPAIERAADLVAILTNLSDRDVLFIDEIQRLNRGIEEILYPAMEDYTLDIIIGKGPAARNMRLPLPRFTLVGATTRAGMLGSPLRDRFGVICRLELYGKEDLYRILRRSARLLNIELDEDAGYEISGRCRGTPRIANRLLRRIRDYAQVRGTGVITHSTASSALSLLEVDELGLDFADRNILLNIIEKFGGGPVGLDTLAAASNEEAVTIEDVVEPFLMQLGFVARTARGRIALPAAYKHLGKSCPVQTDLFSEYLDGNKKD